MLTLQTIPALLDHKKSNQVISTNLQLHFPITHVSRHLAMMVGIWWDGAPLAPKVPVSDRWSL